MTPIIDLSGIDIVKVALLVAALTEAVTTNITWLLRQGWTRSRLIAVFVAVIVALLTGLNLVQAAGVGEVFPYLDVVVTALVGARIANVLNDAAAYLERLRQARQVITTTIGALATEVTPRANDE